MLLSQRFHLRFDDAPDFDPEAYIVRENTNVVLTRDGWIKRVGRLGSVEGTRVREGDEVVAVVPGNTHEHVLFCADDGTAHHCAAHDGAAYHCAAHDGATDHHIAVSPGR